MRSTLVTALAVSCIHGAVAQPAPLPAYNVDPSQVSVSGHASGGSMAVQLAVAYSSRIMGAGAFAAFPYDCLRSGNVTRDDCFGRNTPDIEGLAANIARWSGNRIDAAANLARQRIYVYVGRNDTSGVGVSSPTVVAETAALFERFAPIGNVRYESTIYSAHVFPTDFDNPYSTSQGGCSVAATVPIANCGFDGAGAALSWIYGPLAPRNEGSAEGTLLLVDQGAYATPDKGMDAVAWLYVPASCAKGAACRLHVFLHDCGQSFFSRGDAFYADYSGHRRWADTNGIVLLFPQTLPESSRNPEGCWDTEGRYDDNYDQKAGAQTSAIMSMVARITSGYRPGPRAIEFHHAQWGHYFLTTNPNEIARLDAGDFEGWTRTGESFATFPVDAAGASNVCRFFSTSFAPRSSHFYTPDAAECLAVRGNADWQFEGLAFAVALPDAAGQCRAATEAVYRLFNNGQGGAPNHRYTTSSSTRLTMLAQEWVAEGHGSLGVIGCVPAAPASGG